TETDDALDARITELRQTAGITGCTHRIDDTTNGVHQGAVPVEDQQLVVRHSGAPAWRPRTHRPAPRPSAQCRPATSDAGCAHAGTAACRPSREFRDRTPR